MLCFAKENGFGKSWKFLLAKVRRLYFKSHKSWELKKKKNIVAAFYSEANEDSE